MSKAIIMIFILSITLLIQKSFGEERKEYKNSDLGIQFKYPQNYKITGLKHKNKGVGLSSSDGNEEILIYKYPNAAPKLYGIFYVHSLISELEEEGDTLISHKRQKVKLFIKKFYKAPVITIANMHRLIFKDKKGNKLKIIIYYFNYSSKKSDGYTISFYTNSIKSKTGFTKVFRKSFTLLSSKLNGDV